MEEKSFKEKVEVIANLIKDMPRYQWEQIKTAIDREYSREFSAIENHHKLEKTESIIHELKMLF